MAWRVWRSQPDLITISMDAASEQFADNLAMSDGLLDNALDVFRLHPPVPNALAS